jgi:signal transduction histidine kinase
VRRVHRQPGRPGFLVADDVRGAVLGQQLTARATEGEAGWGIGLHTVYTLVARLGGVVSLRNGPAGGAEVRVMLPVAQLANIASQIVSGA